jgi:hypothetical protein
MDRGSLCTPIHHTLRICPEVLLPQDQPNVKSVPDVILLTEPLVRPMGLVR